MIYLFHGTSPYLSRTKLKKQTEKFIMKYGDINYAHYLDDTPTGTILEALSQNSLFAEKRLIVVENLLTRIKSELSQIVEALKKTDANTFILLFEKREIKPTDEIVHIAKEHGSIFLSNAQSDAELQDFINQYVRDGERTIDAPTVRLLATTHALDIPLLVSELDKLIALSFHEKKITQQMVQNTAHTRKTIGIFSVSDAFMLRDYKKCMNLMCSLIDEGESAIAIIGSIAYQLRMLIIAKSHKDEKIPQTQVLIEHKLKPYPLSKAAQYAAKYSYAEIALLYTWVMQTDIRLKSGLEDDSSAPAHLMALVKSGTI